MEHLIWLFFIILVRNVLLLKGLGQAILGNFSTDQMVIEFTKTSQ